MYDKYLKLPSNSHKGELLLKINGKQNKSFTLKTEENAQVITLIPRRLGAIAVDALFYKDGEYFPCLESHFEWSGISRGFDEYSLTVKKGSLTEGLYFIQIAVCTNEGRFFVKKNLGEVSFVRESGDNPSVQLTVSRFLYDEPKKAYGGIIYHVFVDRFSRGKGAILKEGNINIDGEWESIPEYPEYAGAHLNNNTFYGGNLDGVSQRLPYLASLGVSIVYLSPIFEAASNHKYDTSDYMKVDEGFGGDEALRRLIEEAKKFDIKIILDGVFNHTGDNSIYFNRYGKYKNLGAYQSETSEYYNWYDFRSFPDDYNCWWGIKILPRIHPDKEGCGEYFLKDGGVIDKYRKMGIYGMRLDVADELSDNFLAGIKKRLSEDGESYLLGEVWEDGSNKVAYDVRKRYYLGSELDGVMNYPLREGIIDYLVNKNTDKLRYALTDILENAPKSIRNALMNLLGTHDTKRIITVLSGVKYDGLSNKELSKKRLSENERVLGEKRLLLAYTILATVPGIPSIYYGDEVGLEGFSDPFNRMPYPYGKENVKILDFYKKIGIIRRGNSVYKEGDFELLYLDGEILAFSRKEGKASLVTVINNSDSDIYLESDKVLFSLIDGRKGKSILVEGTSPAIISAAVGASFKIRRG